MDISKLLREARWVFEDSSGKRWNVAPYSIHAEVALEDFLEDREADNLDALDGVRIVFSTLCTEHDGAEGAETEELAPTETDIETLTPDDLQRFSQQFVENYPGILDGIDDGAAPDHEQLPADYLIDLLKERRKLRQAQMKDLFSGVTDRLKGALKSPLPGIKGISEEILRQHGQIEKRFPYETSTPPKQMIDQLHLNVRNPVLDTNDRLDDIADRLGKLTDFGIEALRAVSGIQSASVQFLAKFSEEAERNSRSAFAAIVVGGFAVVIAIAQIAYTEFRRVPIDNAAQEAALSRLETGIDRVAKSLTSELDAAQQLQAQTSGEISSAIRDSAGASADVLERIESLLRERNEIDAQMLEILEELDTRLASEGLPETAASEQEQQTQ
ncbi:MAG: hypothetical protein ACX93U_00060 [Salipiger thiooxidans]|uniref:hypothetical protein n=1 Tax=Salipiger thiooxidans TaxID=282683 RepID=UPI001CF9D643|nr:hypothetical protein [Salipiger thiooxidans]